MHYKRLNQFFIALGFALLMAACSPSGGEHAGDEYMPDMYHSIAFESNYYDYYYYNTWGSEQEYYKFAQPRKPVAGTIPRGYAGVSMAADPEAQQAVMKVLSGQDQTNSIAVPVNGQVPYYYENTEDERLRATAEIIQNPYAITEEGLTRAKDLYNIYCGICHGEKGNGVGYLVSEENANAAYIAQPANFLSEEFLAASNGRYYHAIMYGKNVMGGYADKLSYEERWQVIHYIRSLQAKETKLTYNETENTLNTVDIPGAKMRPVAMAQENEGEVAPADHSETPHSAEGH